MADAGAKPSGDPVLRSARVVEVEDSWWWALFSSNKISDLSAVFPRTLSDTDAGYFLVDCWRESKVVLSSSWRTNLDNPSGQTA